MSKHTPGPWNYSFESVDPEWASVATNDGAIVANVNADKRQEANARIIAAAPEMAEALNAALECLETNGFAKAYTIDVIRAAIKKAGV